MARCFWSAIGILTLLGYTLGVTIITTKSTKTKKKGPAAFLHMVSSLCEACPSLQQNQGSTGWDDSMAAALISPDGGQAHAPRGQRMDEDAWPGVKIGEMW
jgi:hypothetical protein